MFISLSPPLSGLAQQSQELASVFLGFIGGLNDVGVDIFRKIRALIRLKKFNTVSKSSAKNQSKSQVINSKDAAQARKINLVMVHKIRRTCSNFIK
jgi:hypothetical protein